MTDRSRADRRPILRIAIYLRQSQDKHGDELAVSRQWDDCLALCQHKGWTNPVRYEDNDTSATSRKPRPAYQRLLEDIAAGRIDAVVVWDLDRLHRRPIELEYFMELADKHGLALATVTGDVDLSTDNGRLFARIKGAVACAEVERKTARQKLAVTQIAKNGRSWWAGRMFGYDADRDPATGAWWTYDKRTDRHNPIRLHDTEAPLVATAYDSVLAGTALYRIAADWNARGCTTPRGTLWRGSAVRTLLLAARNANLREHHGEIVGSGNWPRIVDEDKWRGVVAVLSDPKRGGRAPRGRKRLLSGLAVGECGHRLGGGVTCSSGTLTYLCKSCGRVSRAAEPIDAMVIEAVVDRLSREDAAELVVDRTVPNIDELMEQRRSLREQQKAVGSKLAKGTVSMAFAEAADRGFTDEIEALSAQIDNAPRAEIFADLIGADDVDAAFGALDLGRQRTVIAALVTVVVKRAGRGRRQVSRDDVDIDFRR